MAVDRSLSQMPGHLIRRLNQQSTSVFHDKIREAGYDITPVQFAALFSLEDIPGQDQTGLAKSIGYDRATIGGVVKRLLEKGLISRIPDQKDKRAFQLLLSVKGASLLSKLKPLVMELQNDILSQLTPSENADLIRLLKKALHTRQ